MIKEKFDELFINSISDVVYDFELCNFTKDILVKNKHNIPKLFRFSSADYYNIRGLETQTLFLSPIGFMNDIFEGLSCEIDDDVINHIDDLRDIAYLKSFSENKDSLLMWAHYAEDYAGMCVEYDFSKFSDEYLFHLFPIHYSKKRTSNRNLEYVIDEHKDLKRSIDDKCDPIDINSIKDIMALFLTKSCEWSYEKEWRLLVTYSQMNKTAEEMDDENGELYSVNSQVLSVADCIKSVYLGPRMKQNIKNHIKEICRDKLNNIPVYSSKLSKNKYELEYCLEEE